MASLPNTKLVSYEEGLEMPADKNEEVVNGEICIRPVGRLNQALIVANINAGLIGQVDTRSGCAHRQFWFVIHVARLTCRSPDLAVLDQTAAVAVDGHFRSTTGLAIEVLSPRNPPKDMRRKILDYASLGLPELWIFSKDHRTVEVLLLEDGRLRRSALLSGGVLRPTRFPQVAIEIAPIWPD